MRLLPIALIVAGVSAAVVVPEARLAAQAPAFDVVSVKPVDVTTSAVPIRPAVGDVQPGGVWRSSATLLALLRYAYPGHDVAGQIVGAPQWYTTQFFVIDARAAATTTDAGFRTMARTLLADRFHLQLHTDTRNLPAFALTRRADARLGPGMTPPAVDCEAYRAAKAKGEPLPVDPTRKAGLDRLPCTSAVMPALESTRVVPGANRRLTAGGATIDSLIPLFAQALQGPVVNRTGLTGTYDIELQYSTGLISATVDVGPTAREAIASQLGLRVEESQTPMDVLVIDRVQLPDPD
jgi:uncharacterized protein (TIGR03435 family)